MTRMRDLTTEEMSQIEGGDVVPVVPFDPFFGFVSFFFGLFSFIFLFAFDKFAEREFGTP